MINFHSMHKWWNSNTYKGKQKTRKITKSQLTWIYRNPMTRVRNRRRRRGKGKGLNCSFFPFKRVRWSFSPSKTKRREAARMFPSPSYIDSPTVTDRDSATSRSTVQNRSNGCDMSLGFVSCQERKRTKDIRCEGRKVKSGTGSFGWGYSTKRINIGARWKRVPRVPKCPFSSFGCRLGAFLYWACFPFSAICNKSNGLGKMRSGDRSRL